MSVERSELCGELGPARRYRPQWSFLRRSSNRRRRPRRRCLRLLRRPQWRQASSRHTRCFVRRSRARSLAKRTSTQLGSSLSACAHSHQCGTLTAQEMWLISLSPRKHTAPRALTSRACFASPSRARRGLAATSSRGDRRVRAGPRRHVGRCVAHEGIANGST